MPQPCDQTAVYAADAAPDSDERRDPRSALMLRCWLVDRRRRKYACFLRNISRRGVSARGWTDLVVGQRVMIVLPNLGGIGAVVRWINGQRFGLLLDLTIDPGALILANTPVDRQSTFQPMEIHRPVTENRRPGFRMRRAASVDA